MRSILGAIVGAAFALLAGQSKAETIRFSTTHPLGWWSFPALVTTGQAGQLTAWFETPTNPFGTGNGGYAVGTTFQAWDGIFMPTSETSWLSYSADNLTQRINNSGPVTLDILTSTVLIVVVRPYDGIHGSSPPAFPYLYMQYPDGLIVRPLNAVVTPLPASLPLFAGSLAVIALLVRRSRSQAR